MIGTLDEGFRNPDRRQWLKMLELALDMVYGAVPDADGEYEEYEDDARF